MVVGKLPVPGHPTNLDNSGAREYWACSMCGKGLLRHFSLICHFSILSPSLWEMSLCKYCLKVLLNATQPTNFFGHITRVFPPKTTTKI